MKIPDKTIIIQTLKKSDDFDKTFRLIEKFDNLKKDRKEFYLTLIELDEILKWKLRDQYGRQKEIRSKNTDEIIQKITKTAFSIEHKNLNLETEFKVNLLTSLIGVGIPVASAILTLCYPKEYGVIDFRNWRWIFNEKKNSYSIKNYIVYLTEIRKMAEDKKITTQEMDMYIWVMDKNSN